PGVDVPNGIKVMKVMENIENADVTVGVSSNEEFADGLRGGANGNLQSLKNFFIGGSMTGSTVRALGKIGKMQVKGAITDTTTQVGGAVGVGLGKLLLTGVLDNATFDVTGGLGKMKMTKSLENSTFIIGGAVK